MKALSISRAWDETRGILQRDGKLLVTVAAALVLLPQAIAGVITGQTAGEEGGQLGLVMLVAALIGLVGQLALAWMAAGARSSVGESIRHGFVRALPMIAAMLIVLAGIVVIGLIAALVLTATGAIDPAVRPTVGDAMKLMLVLAIPLIFLSVRLMPSVVVAANEQVGPIGILKRSWTLTRGHFLRLFGFLVIFLIAAIVVAGAFGLIGGLLVRVAFPDTGPFTMGALVLALINGVVQAGLILVYVVMLARIYLQLAGQQGSEVSVPHSGG